MPLALLAERTGVAVLLVMHLNKNSKADALYRVNGSIGFSGVARLVLAVGPDPDDPNPYAPGAVRAIAGLKQNIVEAATPWAYRTANNRVEWIEPREDLRADLLLAGGARPSEAGGVDVGEFLCRVLADGQYQESTQVEALARDEGITKDRLFRKRKQMCEATRDGFGAGSKWQIRLKPEYRRAPEFAAAPEDCARIEDCTEDRALPPDAIFGKNATASALKSTPLSKIAGCEGAAIFGSGAVSTISPAAPALKPWISDGGAGHAGDF
jgi:hypothetical protein